MNYILFDDHKRQDLLPFTYTRPAADIRIGILTIREKWEHLLKAKTSTLSANYLSRKFPLRTGEENIMINGRVAPGEELIGEIGKLKIKHKLTCGGTLVAIRVSSDVLKRTAASGTANNNSFTDLCNDLEDVPFNPSEKLIELEHPWDIFLKNEEAIRADFKMLTSGRKSAPLSKTNQLIGSEIFVEEGARVECSVINASAGPVYIGRNAEVMEGCLIRGPFALCEEATLKLGAKIYGASTIGPHCKAGGEISNSVIFGYSNKAHDGFIGNSVIGEWCNLGADSNCSNLKNNYGNVKIWNYNTNDYTDTGLQFCGLMMGDHSKCGINTMFNTGTVVGVSANIYGSGFPNTHIPSFAWGGANGFTEYRPEKALEVAQKVMERRHIPLTEDDKQILREVFEQTKSYRKT